MDSKQRIFKMKTALFTIIFTSAFTLGLVAQAAPINAARIDIDSMAPDVVFLTPGETRNGTAENKPGGEWRNSAIRTSFPAGADWKQGSFSFTPDKDGALTVHVIGAWAREEADRTWVICDAVTVDGAEMKNGDFENGTQGWWKTGKEKSASLVDSAKSGEKAAKVNHDNGFMQKIAVKGGTPVTVSFWYKLAE